MAFLFRQSWTGGVKKCTSQGSGGRGRRIRVSMKHMNKHKKRSHKKYRGQGR